MVMAAMLLVPPWKRLSPAVHYQTNEFSPLDEPSRSYPASLEPAGYHFLFTSRFPSVDVSRLAVQLALVLILTGGALLLLKEEKK
jgi:hypothetical protein